MIHKLLSIIEDWRLPSSLLSRVWDIDGVRICDLKGFAVDNGAGMGHLEWRIIDIFVQQNGYNDQSFLDEIFSKPLIPIQSFRRELSKIGVKPADSQKAIEKWLMTLDQLHAKTGYSSSSGDQLVEEKTKKRSKKAPELKSNLNQTIANKELDEKLLEIEARKNLGLYEDDDYIIDEGPMEVHKAKEGLGPYRPVDINNSFHNGFLYYPVQTVIGKRHIKGDDSRIAEKVETVVIRSDRTLQKIVKSDRLQDGDGGQDVYRLTDGTLIHSIPRPNSHGTWSWEYIDQFLKGENQKIKLSEAIKTFRKHIRSRVWLPLDSDYTLLAITAVATYVQSIFDSVPLILLMGPPGSGKSEVASAMVDMSANATLIGQVSAPTMMRLIDESGGLCAIDDLESVGVSKTGPGGKQKFSEIAQVLKVSYKKSTAIRMVTNPSTRRTEIMNFFGIKIVSNTKGVDDILGSRMLHVHTRKIDVDTLEKFQERETVEEEELQDLRNRLHSWAFENVDLVHRTYMVISAKQSNREDEISQPLRTMAKLSGDENLILDLERSLSAQAKRKNKFRSPIEVLKDIVETLVINGYESLSITHVMLELRREMDPGYVINYSTEMPGWSKQEWIGRKLRELDITDQSKSFRKRVRGQNLRFITLKKEYLKSIQSGMKGREVDVRKPESFCKSCESCPFASHSCELAGSGDLSQAS
jgi:hypothetical protein